MAQIDVSDILLDADFVDPIVLVHRTAIVDSFGQNQLTESSVKTIGSVQPASGRDIMRLPESLRLSDVRSFYVKAEIKADGSSQYPDVIIYRGFRFRILNCQGWLKFGQGWNVGMCVKETPQ